MHSRLLVLCVGVMWVSAVWAQDSPRPPDGMPSPGAQSGQSGGAPTPDTPPTAPPRVQEPPPPSERPRPEAPQSSKWGAVAYTADGAFGASYGIDTKEDAERLAIDECLRESTDKADCSRGVIARQDSWFHIQFCQRGRDWSTHVTSRPTLAETNQAASQFAKTSKYGAENCRMVPNGLFHSGGLHTKM